MTKDKDIATINQNTSVALSEEFMAELAAEAKDAAALERPSVSTISLRAGIISYNGEPIKGNILRCVVLAGVYLNSFYDTDWDPDVVSPPKCFALSETGKGMVPHPNVKNPQHPTCEGCPQSEWGSAGGKSRGKACKEVRRIILMPEDVLESAELVAKAEMASLKIPVTSVAAWSNFVNALSATLKLPYYTVITEITTQPDAKTQFKVIITPVERIKDAEVLMAVRARREAAYTLAMLPYEIDEGVDEKTAEKF